MTQILADEGLKADMIATMRNRHAGGLPSRHASSARARKAVLRGTTALALALAASAAQAQCANPAGNPAIPVFGVLPNFGLNVGSSASAVSSLVSVLTTQNTVFLTQTSAFIGAPSNPPENIEGGGVWARGLGGTFDTKVPANFGFTSPNLLGGVNAIGSCSVRSYQDYTGFQAGADIARLNVDGYNIHGGVTMGYTDSTTRTNGPFSAQFQTPFVGVYGALTKGSFFADAQVRFDFFQGNLNDVSNTLTNQRLDARSVSVTGNLGYQFQLNDGWFVEPSAGAVYAQAHVDPLKTGGEIFVATSPNFSFPYTARVRDFDSILARGSLRIGKNFVVDGYALQPFFTASVINEFADPVRTDISSNFGAVASNLFAGVPAAVAGLFDSSQRVSTYRIGTYGQFSLGLAGQVLNTGWVGYIRGDYRTGERVEGYGISGGLRYQFTPENLARPLITKGDSGILPVLAAPVNWTGFSVGGSVGSLWSQTRQYEAGIFIDQFFTVKPRVSGVYAGGQIGYDYQFANNVVIGVAGDGGFTNARGGRGCSTGESGNVYNCQSNLDSLSMATARLGYASERALYYVKGGAAFGNGSDLQQNNFNGAPLVFPLAPAVGNNVLDTLKHFSRTGWALGAGFEFAITRTISAKAEYMHYDLGTKRYGDFGSLTNQAFVTSRNSGDLVKIGVNYHFVPEAAVPVVSKY